MVPHLRRYQLIHRFCDAPSYADEVPLCVVGADVHQLEETGHLRGLEVYVLDDVVQALLQYAQRDPLMAVVAQ